MCRPALETEATEIGQVLYYGIYADSVAITVYDGEPAVANEFQDAETYRHYVKWNAVRMGDGVRPLRCVTCRRRWRFAPCS
jgi:hypothetical protein